MDIVLGQDAAIEHQVVHAGRPRDDATVSVQLYTPHGATLGAPVVAVNAGEGWYAVTVTGASVTSEGLYRARWTVTLPGPVSLPAEDLLLVRVERGPLITRREQRWDVAGQFEEDYFTRGTVSAADATHITVPEAAAPESDWVPGEVYIYAGTGRGQARKILASGDYTGVLTVATWTTTPDATSLVELHRRFTVDQINRAINRAILQARDAYLEIADTTLVATDAYEYAIPSGFEYVSLVETDDGTDSNIYTRLRHGDDWDVGAGVLWLAAPPEDYRLRVRGFMRAPQLYRDDAYLDLDPSYVLFAACALLAASEIAASPLDRHAAAATAGYYQTLAQGHMRRSALENAVAVR
jgi:hypothetical protein